MSRMSSDAIVVRPTNNVYTVLAIVAFLLELIAFIALFLKAREVFPPNGIF
jgi:hypothetical protein